MRKKVVAEIAIAAIGTNQARSAKSWDIGKVDSTNRDREKNHGYN
jgi:hypothetical protein